MPVVPLNPLVELSARELHVLALMAEGYTNAGISAACHLSTKTVESHVRNIYRKLDLPATPYAHRRVMAVLIYHSAAAAAAARRPAAA